MDLADLLIPQFIVDMVNNESNAESIGFSNDGLSIEIRNTAKLGTEVLPKYFKHGNVSSLIRQLNNYEFKTIRKSCKSCYATES